MANNYEQIMMLVDAGNKMGLSNTITRDNGIPLDLSSVYNSYESAVIYAATKNIAYQGQPIAVVTDTDATLYIITPDKQGSLTIGSAIYDVYLKQIGGATPLDNKSITLTNEGTLSIAGFSVAEGATIPQKQSDNSIKWVNIGDLVEGGGNTKSVVVSNDSQLIVTSSHDTDTDTYTYTLSLNIDLSNYYQKSEVDAIVDAEVARALAAEAQTLIDAKSFTTETVTGLDVVIESNDNIQYIIIKDKDGNEIASADASIFTRDSFLDDVTYDAASGKIKFTWLMGDSSTKTDEILISDFVKTYSAGSGLALQDGKFSVDTTVIATVEQVTSLSERVTEVVNTLSEYVQTTELTTLLSEYAKTQEIVDVYATKEEVVGQITDIETVVETATNIANQALENVTLLQEGEITTISENVNSLVSITDEHTTQISELVTSIADIIQPKESEEITVATDGTLGVKLISTDKLVQGEHTIVIDGGTATE